MTTKAVRYTQPLLGSTSVDPHLVAVSEADEVLILQNGAPCLVYADNDKTPLPNPVTRGVAPGTAGLSTHGELLVYLEAGRGYGAQVTVGTDVTIVAFPDVSPDVADVVNTAAMDAALATTAPLTTPYGGGVSRVNEGPLSLLDQRLAPGNPADVTDWGAVLVAAKAMFRPSGGYHFDPRGGGHAYAPPGIYPMVTGFPYDDNVVIEGSGPGTIFLAKTNDMEMFSATATDSFGMFGGQLLNVRLMADQGVTGVRGFASHAFGVGSGGFSGWLIRGLVIWPQYGASPIYGNIDRGLHLDFFIESKVHADIQGCTSENIYIDNNTNVTDVDGQCRVAGGWGMVVDGGSFPRTMPGWVCEGNNGNGGVWVKSGWPRMYGCHMEQSGVPDIQLDNGAVSVFGGELVYAAIASGCYDWKFDGVLIRGSVDIAAGVGTGVIAGGAGGWSDPSRRAAIESVRDGSDGIVKSVLPGFTLPSGTVPIDALGTTLGGTGAKLAVRGKPAVDTPAVFGGTTQAKLDALVAAMDLQGWVRDISTLPASDDFNRPDNSTSMGVVPSNGMSWQAMVGSWGIIGNQAYCESHVGTDYVVVETGKSDCTVKVTLTVAGGGGLIVRGKDAANHLRVYNGGQSLSKVVGGVETTLLGYYAVGVDGDVVEVVVNGSSITLKRNGAVLGSVTETDLETNTRHGLSNIGAGSPPTARFDNFSVV